MLTGTKAVLPLLIGATISGVMVKGKFIGRKAMSTLFSAFISGVFSVSPATYRRTLPRVRT